MTDLALIDRRSLLGSALALVGATGAAGFSPEALAAAVKSGKRQLDGPRYALLVALADTIIPKTDTPGAVDAGVPELVDALLGTWASPQRRDAIIGALDKIDMLARQKRNRAFTALSPAEREELLIPHDAAALKIAPPTPPPAVPVGAAPTTVDPNYGRAKQEATQSLMDRMSPRFSDPGYGKLKELIVIGYYYSEAALSAELPYEHSPGVWDPSTPVTPETRPWGGAALS